MRKALLRLIAGLVISMLVVSPSMALNIGYVVLGSPGNTDPESAITGGGHTHVALGQLSGADLSGVDALWVLNPSNFGYSTDYTNNLALVENFVNGGGGLIFHDRYVTDAASVIPGAAGVSFFRDFTDDANIEIAAGAEDLAAAMGVDNTTLDGGTSSSHGYSLLSTLPPGAVAVFTRTDPNEIVDFYFDYGSGQVYYSTIPVDWYLGEVNPFAFYVAELNAVLEEYIVSVSMNGFAELHTSVPQVAFTMIDSFQDIAGSRMLHLRQSGHDAFALKDPLDGLMLASAGDVTDIGPITGEGEKSKHFWGKLYGITGDVNGDDSIAGYDYSIGGFVLGSDFSPCKGVYLGAMAGISSGNADTDLGDDFDVQSYQLGLYTSYENGPYYLDGVLSYAMSDYDTSRATTMGTARGDYDGEELGAAVEFGYVMSKDNTIFEPYIGTQYIYVDQDSFSETGAGTMNMAIKSRDTYSWEVMAGGRISGVYEQESGALFVPELRFAFKHELGDNNDTVVANFVTTPAANNFVFDGLDLKREMLELGVGLKVLQANNVDLDIDLTTEFNGDQQAYIASVGLKYSW